MSFTAPLGSPWGFFIFSLHLVPQGRQQTVAARVGVSQGSIVRERATGLPLVLTKDLYKII